MSDPRFNPPASPRAHCLNCRHGAVEKGVGVVCLHPSRPAEKREVVKWYAHNCQQHQPQEN